MMFSIRRTQESLYTEQANIHLWTLLLEMPIWKLCHAFVIQSTTTYYHTWTKPQIWWGWIDTWGKRDTHVSQCTRQLSEKMDSPRYIVHHWHSAIIWCATVNRSLFCRKNLINAPFFFHDFFLFSSFELTDKTRGFFYNKGFHKVKRHGLLTRVELHQANKRCTLWLLSK